MTSFLEAFFVVVLLVLFIEIVRLFGFECVRTEVPGQSEGVLVR